MLINWFTWIIYSHDHKCYAKKMGITVIIKFYPLNSKIPLPWWKQGNYLVITIYANNLWLNRSFHRPGDQVTKLCFTSANSHYLYRSLVP